MKQFIFSLSICIVMCSCAKNKVDLIVHNATIYTVDSAFSKAEAMAIKDGKIVETGTNNFILKKYSSNEIMDANKKFIYPGLIDAHAHFLGYAQSLFQVQLSGTNSWQEVIDAVKKFHEEHPDETWIRGRGWDQNDWDIKQFPDNTVLNQLFPNNPVLLIRVDGHAAIANQKALELSNIKPNQTLVGGEVEVKKGKLTGILIDNAIGLVRSNIPDANIIDYEKWLLAAQQNCFEFGLTTITDCGLNYKDVDMIDVLQKNNKLNMRLYVMLSDNKENLDYFLPKGPYKTEKLFVKGIKVYADGALGSRGACLLQHYTDKPGWGGFLLSNKSHYDSLAQVLVKTDFQMCTHAIGDSANREILNIYTKVLGGKNDKRWRIEHAQVVNQNDFNLFGNSNIIPSVQPTHATSDMYWAKDRLGNERVKEAYAFKQLMQQNGWVPLGTDFPVEDINPFKTFLASVFRKDSNGFPDTGFQKENALSREETVRGMTIWAAKANFMEKEIGSLEKGKQADFIILNKDFMSVQESDILKIKVTSTYSNGKNVFLKK